MFCVHTHTWLIFIRQDSSE